MRNINCVNSINHHLAGDSKALAIVLPTQSQYKRCCHLCPLWWFPVKCSRTTKWYPQHSSVNNTRIERDGSQRWRQLLSYSLGHPFNSPLWGTIRWHSRTGRPAPPTAHVDNYTLLSLDEGWDEVPHHISHTYTSREMQRCDSQELHCCIYNPSKHTWLQDKRKKLDMDM